MPRLLPACLACFFLSFFLMQKAAAQQWEMADTTKAKALIDEFVKQGMKKKSPENDLRLDTARAILTGLGLQEGLLYAKLLFLEGNLSFAKRNDLALRLSNFQKCAQLRRALLPSNHVETCQALMSIGQCYFDMDEYDRCVSIYREVEAMLLLHPEPNLGYFARLYNQWGLVLHNIGFDEKALELYQKSLDFTLKSTPTSVNVGYIYQNMSNVYTQQRDFQKALEYIIKATAVKIKARGTERSLEIARHYVTTALIHHYLGNETEALDYVVKSTDLIRGIEGDSSVELNGSYNVMGIILNEQGKSDSSILFYQKSLALWEKQYGKQSKEVAFPLANLGVAYYDKGSFDTSIFYFKKARDIRAEHFKEKPLDMAYTLNWLAKPQIDGGYLEDAANTLRQIKTTLNYHANRPLIEMNNTVEGVIMLGNSAALQFALFEKTQNNAHLDTAIQDYERGETLFRHLLATITAEEPKVAMTGQRSNIYHNLLNCYAEKQRLTGDHIWKEKSFNLLNHSLGQNLQTQLRNREAVAQANLSSADIMAERDARLSIAHLENESLRAIATGKPRQDTSLLSLTLHIERAKHQYATLQTELQKRYPKYRRLLAATDTVSLAHFQKNALAEDQCLLTFISGSSGLMAVVISKKDFRTVNLTIPRNFLTVNSRALLEGISDFHTAVLPDESRYPALLAKYTTAAQQLYQKLIEPLENILTPRVVVLTASVMPDLPFEALLSEKPTKPGDFSTYPFLAKKFAFSYAYAPAMLMPQASFPENPSSNTGRSTFLGFAPWFDGKSAAYTFWSPEELRDEAFQPLRYSGQEILDAQKTWGGQAFTGAEATEENFLKHAPGANIIHLATHGQSDPRIGDYSWLAFAPKPDSTENELLFARELAPINLTADLVILSACKTGVARFQRGEGMLGLPRAFVLAGAKSVLSTQWAVNDASAAALMQQFHRRLAAGKPKDVALQEAKIAFLKKHGSAAHPYFWSGFLLTGSTAPIRKK